MKQFTFFLLLVFALAPILSAKGLMRKVLIEDGLVVDHRPVNSIEDWPVVEIEDTLIPDGKLNLYKNARAIGHKEGKLFLTEGHASRIVEFERPKPTFLELLMLRIEDLESRLIQLEAESAQAQD